MKIKQVLHSYSTTVVGWLIVLAGALLPVIRLFTNSAFVNSLLYGATADRVAAWHQIVTTFIVSCAVMLTGAIGLWVGKGPIQSILNSAAKSGGNASADAIGNQSNSAEGK